MRRKIELGVIIGRFQLDKLHKGHKNFISLVESKSDRQLIFLGTSVTKNTKRSPLDFDTRAVWFRDICPNAEIDILHDMKADYHWSRQVDAKIDDYIQSTGYYNDDFNVTLYGSRDSFIPHYEGRYHVEELPCAVETSATERREKLALTPINSKKFRQGVIYGAYNRWAISFTCVDVALLNEDQTQVLLGRKKNEVEFRFIGGFVDPTDANLEAAVRRETAEETGVEIDDIKYICSTRVDDWRYKRCEDQIMTTFFATKYVFGAPIGQDDIEEVKWFTVKDLTEENVVGEHGTVLLPALKKYLGI